MDFSVSFIVISPCHFDFLKYFLFYLEARYLSLSINIIAENLLFFKFSIHKISERKIY
jgi:hypothetical protein